MKSIFVISLFLLNINKSFANENKLTCSIRHIPNVTKWLDEQYYNTYDKFKHCAGSCYLSLRCNRSEVRLLGILKEIQDAFGRGNAEWEDIKADFYGVRLVRKRVALDDESCALKCDQKYPSP